VAPSSPDSRASWEINVINPARASAAAGLTCDAKDLRRSSRPSRTRERAKAGRPRACCATMSGWNSRRTGTRGMATVLSPYQVVGDGRIDLVYLQEFLSNVILNWEHPAYARFQPQLADLSRSWSASRPTGDGATASAESSPPHFRALVLPLVGAGGGLTAERLLVEHRVALAPGEGFGSTAPAGRGCRSRSRRGARGRARAAPGRFRLAACWANPGGVASRPSFHALFRLR
jgi:hypothetical protein